MPSQQEIDEATRKAITRYNQFRSPEAIAKLIHTSPETITIAFTGAFCSSCGILGYVEGFIHDFEALNNKLKLKIDKTRQEGTRIIEVDYKIKTR